MRATTDAEVPATPPEHRATEQERKAVEANFERKRGNPPGETIQTTPMQR